MSGAKAEFCDKFNSIASQLAKQVNRAVRKSNLKLSTFEASLVNAENTCRSNFIEAGIWNQSYVDPITMFDGTGDVKNIAITDDILHVKTGFILDKVPKDEPVKINLKTNFLTMDTNQPVEQPSEQIEVTMSKGANALFYSYIKNALNRRINLVNSDETLKNDTINLSKAMKVLCEWTSFCGAVRNLKRPGPNLRDQPDDDEPSAQHARCKYIRSNFN